MARRLPAAGPRPARRTLPKWTAPLDALRTVVSAPGALRPGRGRQLATRRTCARPSGCSRRCRSRSPTTAGSARGCSPVPARQDLPARGQLPLHAPRHRADRRRGEGARRVADPLRRARVQRLDVRGPRHRLDAVRPALRRSSGAIGALKGPLHGGANEKVMDVLRAAGGPGHGREVDARRPGPQGADHGLRPPRLQDRRRAGRHPQGVRPARRPRPADQLAVGGHGRHRSSG